MARKRAGASHTRLTSRSRPSRAVVRLAPEAVRRARAAYTELTGAKSVARGVPATLLHSLATLRPGAPAPVALFEVFERRRQGEACGQRVEIAGIYQNPVPAGQAPLGAPAVLALLNGAAAAKCTAILDCPRVCPCTYEPRAQLAAYSFQNGLEEGYLLQQTQVWNCFCALTEDPT